MYDNDPAKPRNVEIYCFNFLKQSPPPRVAGSDAAQTRCSQDHEQPISRILLLGKLKYLVCRNLRDSSLKFTLDH